MIEFKLKQIDKILPWGQEPELSLSWFGLTDGDLWLTFGNETIYQYSKEALKHFGDKQTPYNDYYLIRFIEDFTELFDKVRETIPIEFYNLTIDLKKFQSDAKKWLDIYDTDNEDDSDLHFEKYEKLISWTYQRTLDSGHLIGGPKLSFFRRNEIVRIVWDTEYILENGIRLWTASDSSYEMSFINFINKIKVFGQAFFSQMDKQVDLALAKEWGNIKLDKQKLVKEHQKRKADFFSALSLLKQEPVGKTNWAEIEQLFRRMTNEIK